MIVDLALGKNGDLLEIVVILDDLVEVGVALTTSSASSRQPHTLM